MPFRYAAGAAIESGDGERIYRWIWMIKPEIFTG